MAREILSSAVPAVLCFVIIGIALAVRKGTWQGFPTQKKFFKGRSLWLWLLPVFLSAGVMRAQQAKRLCEKELALELDGTTTALQGKVLEIREQDKWTVMILECDGRTDMELKRLQVYLEQPETAPRIGNKIRVRGECMSFAEARNPGEFDYRLYYRSLKLNYRMFAKSCEIVDGSYNRYRESLQRTAVWAAERLELLTASDGGNKDAGIFRAMLLGDKAGLSENIRHMYQKNGIAHLLAVSGLHLSLVSFAAYGILRRLGAGYGAAGIAGGAVLFSYALLTGASPSVVRALIMVLCGFLAAYLGRTYDLLSALALAALCMLWDSPYLICQAGVQLSFGAIMGIGGLAPCLYCDESRLGQGFAVSVGMQMMTLPVVLYHFFQYPLYGVFLNLVVVPVVGIVIASGAAGIAVGGFNLAAGRFAIGSGCGVLRWYEWCCTAFEQLPGSNIIWGRPDFWQIGIYYGILLSAVWLFKGSRRMAAAYFMAVLLLWVTPPGGLEVTFLDVGQGDGICLRTRETTIFVDGGSSDEKKLGESKIEPFLKSCGIGYVDYWVVSHGDQDHISGLLYLMEEGDIAISNLIMPGAGQGDEVYEKLAAMARKRGGKIFWMEENDSLQAGALTVKCLYPQSAIIFGERDRNEHSLVLQVDYGDFCMLLTGDMSGDGENRLMDTMQMPDISVLKAAHHGSRYSTGARWLEQIKPEWAVISCGQDNRYGHPHKETVERLEEKNTEIFQTDMDGAVILNTDGKSTDWSTWLVRASGKAADE